MSRRLDEEANHLFGVLRWRTGIRGGPLELRSDPEHLKWSNGDWRAVEANSLDHWKSLPHGFWIGLEESPERLQITPAQHTSILELTNPGEPLGQDLLQEAWRLVNSNPRSALIMAYAAVETRLKELVVDLQPQTGWLLKSIQSPPVSKILEEYLPHLPARGMIDGKVRRPSTVILKEMRKLAKKRNELVHGQGSDVSPDKVRELLRHARSVLYLLDFYAGHEWAKEHLNPSVWDES